MAAFAQNPAIQKGVKEYINHGLRETGIQTVVVGGGCGVAGCSSTFLVIRMFQSREGPNPQRASVWGLVTAFPGDNIINVERVELSSWTERKAPQLEMKQLVPPSPPKLDILDKRE